MEQTNKAFWEAKLNEIVEPPSEKCVFARLEDAKMAVVMIEFREHEWLKPVLRNAAHVYGGQQDVALVIVCGTANHAFVQREVTASWTNAVLRVMPIDNATIPMYNEMLTSAVFYDLFHPCPAILLIQTDTLTRKRVPLEYLQYSYVGAPWFGPQNAGPVNGVVGNGGYSLRDVAVFKEVCRTNTYDVKVDMAEDLFFSKHANSELKQVAPANMAWAFSVEHVPHADPCGMHQAWRFHSLDKLESWLKDLPGIPPTSTKVKPIVRMLL
jgi:hypothetical protein